MSGPVHGYELLKTIVHLANASMETGERLRRMLQSIAEAFHADRCLFLGLDEIEKDESLSLLARERRVSWAEDGSFASLPVFDEVSLYGLLRIEFTEKEGFSPEERDLLLLISKEMGGAIRNDRLHFRSKQAISDLVALHELEKMAALGDLSANIAHEIKNPLVAIGGFARRLYRALPEEGPEKRYASTIIEEVARLEKVLNQVLTYASNRENGLQECDLRDILEESFSMLPGGSQWQRIQVVKQFSNPLPKVMGDCRLLRQAFFNLIANARQAMQEEGVLSVRAFPASRNGSSWVRVEVEESGTGIVPEDLHHIFNPSFAAKDPGLGPGLPMVHKIVTFHHGQIEVDNHPGEGVTFIVTLPASIEKSEEGRS